MKKQPNILFLLASSGAAALAAADLSFDLAMTIHDLVRALLPFSEAIEKEKQKILARGQDETRTAKEWAQLLAIEREVPDLPSFTIDELGTKEERKLIKVKGQEMMALKELGVLRDAPPMPPPPVIT